MNLAVEKVRVRILNEQGEEPFDLTLEEVANMIQLKKRRYFVVDADTMTLMNELNFEEGQNIVLIPIMRGG